MHVYDVVYMEILLSAFVSPLCLCIVFLSELSGWFSHQQTLLTVSLIRVKREITPLNTVLGEWRTTKARKDTSCRTKRWRKHQMMVDDYVVKEIKVSFIIGILLIYLMDWKCWQLTETIPSGDKEAYTCALAKVLLADRLRRVTSSFGTSLYFTINLA